MKSLSIEKLVELVGGNLSGSCDEQIRGVNSIKDASVGELTFAGSEKYIEDLKASKASAALVTQEWDGLRIPQIVVGNVDAALIAVLEYFAPEAGAGTGVHPTAVVAENAKIAENASVGPFTFIDADAEIGENAIVGPHCQIGRGSKLGKNSRLDANVVIYDNCTVGNFCVIQANSTIGGVGFGYRAVNNMPKLIPHLGGVVIEDFVEIGANCCIDRAKFSNTVIGLGTKIDNLVQIAHNCVLGKCCLIAAQVGIAGSTVFGDGVVMGGQSGCGDHVQVGNGVMVAGRGGVIADVGDGQKVGGFPAVDAKAFMRNVACMSRLPKLMKDFKKLVKKVEKLETTENNS